MRPLYYVDVPRWYTWNQKNRAWTARARHGRHTNKVLSRMYAVAPQDADRFYVRMLLLHVPNAAGFVGPGCLKDTDKTSWRAAAVNLGLVEDDAEFDLLLHEAALTSMPKHMRALFVQILFHCEPAEPLVLWNSHREDLELPNVCAARLHIWGKGFDTLPTKMVLQAVPRTPVRKTVGPPTASPVTPVCVCLI